MSNLISKEKAYEVLTEYYHHKTETQHKALREALNMVPSADIDLSDYSDRLWRNAYEQGRAEAEPKWIPVTERLPEIGEKVLVSTKYTVFTQVFKRIYGTPDRWGWEHNTIKKVIAWMPLPEPWKGGTE